jgi:hypothetical protein
LEGIKTKIASIPIVSYIANLSRFAAWASKDFAIRRQGEIIGAITFGAFFIGWQFGDQLRLALRDTLHFSARLAGPCRLIVDQLLGAETLMFFLRPYQRGYANLIRDSARISLRFADKATGVIAN